MKPGKAVIILQGRYAGKKAIILKNFDEGTKKRPYGHAIVAGVERYPRSVHKAMPRSKIVRRSKMKHFVKVVNYNHLMPTRYGVELTTQKSLNAETVEDPTQKKEATKQIKDALYKKYITGKSKWFFTKLAF